MIAASAIFVFFLIFTKRNAVDFNSVFVSASLFFMFVFYLYPLFFIEKNFGYWFGAWRGVTQQEIYYCYVAFFVFLLGFFVFGFFIKDKGPKIVDAKKSSDSKIIRNNVFLVIACVVLAYYSVELLDPTRAASAYASRRGELQVGRVSFLISIVFAFLKFFLLIVLVEIGARKSFWVLWAAFVFMALTTATGRMSLLTLVSFALVYAFFSRPAKLYMIAIIAFPFLVPFLVNMKSIIYEVAYLNQVPDFISYFYSPMTDESVVLNFGHPVYSFIERDKLLGLVGYRFFYDFFHGFLFYLRAFGVDLGDSLIYYNTEAILGKRESVIPTGYLSFGYIQLSYLGVFFAGIFYRALGLFVGKILRFSRLSSAVAVYLFATMAAFSFYHGEMRVIIMTLFLPVLLIAFFARLVFRGAGFGRV